MSPFLVSRARRLERMFPWPHINRPLLKGYLVNTGVIRALAGRVLTESHGLDNITPNGAVMDRPSVTPHYDLLRQAVLLELDLTGLSHVAAPILRAPLDPHPERPYATDKMHSDIWRGEPRYSINIVIPLWGTEHSTMRFRAPVRDTFRPLEDYSLGDTDGEDYEVPFTDGFIYYFDSMLLHQTVRHSDKQRVSIDLRGLYEERLPGEGSDWKPASDYKLIRQKGAPVIEPPSSLLARKPPILADVRA